MEENNNLNSNPNTGNNAADSQITPELMRRSIKEAKRKGRIQGIVIAMVFVVVIAIGWTGVKIVTSALDGSLYAKAIGAFGGNVLDSKTVEKIEKLYRIMGNTYIEEIDADKVREGIYRGMLDSLDDKYTVYYTKEEYDEMMESSSGSFEGIGAYLSQDPDTMEVRVVRPIKGSPAEAVGIITDDIIVEVDGEDVTGQDINLVVSKVKGEKGTKVKIGVRREGSPDLIYFDVTRAKVDAESVNSEMLDDNIGYIYITEFADATGKQYIEAYDQLIEEGMDKVIIDLRANGGGYVDTAVDVAARMIKKGTIVSIKDRHGIGYTYEDPGDGKYSDIPCVVLVDGNTASASEILTGALKDHGIATIIGTQTFGKGIVQDVLPVGDGSGVKITNSKYYTPNGENIHGIGIEPDYIVEWDRDMMINEGVDNQLEAAKKYLLDGKIE